MALKINILAKWILKSIVTIFLFALSGCSLVTDHQIPDPDNPDEETKRMKGSIVLPEGSPVKLQDMEILTAAGLASINGTTYVVDTLGSFSVSLLTDEQDKVILMRYNYPGQDNNNISAESTALALIMNSLIVHTLAPEAKLKFIAAVLNDSNFNALSDAVSQLVVEGRSFTESNDQRFGDLILKLYQSSSAERLSEIADYQNPVDIRTANSELLIQSNDVSHTYVSGIYLDGVLQRRDTITGRPRLATSITEALKGIFGLGYGDPKSVHYSMTSNGIYNIKMRSGRYSAGLDDPEDYSAFFLNAGLPVMETIFELTPTTVSNCPRFKIGLLAAVESKILNYLKGDFNKLKSDTDYLAMYEAVLIECLSLQEDFYTGCQGLPPGFGRFAEQYASVLQVYGRVAKTAKLYNIFASFFDYKYSRPRVDTCFQVRGLKTFPCNIDLTPTRTLIISGDKQRTSNGSILPSPLMISVRNKSDRGVPGIEVIWKIKNGNGTLKEVSTITNAIGIASAYWTLGDGPVQEVEVTAKDFDGKVINGSPLKFTATATPSDILAKLLGRWSVESYTLYINTPLQPETREGWLSFESEFVFRSSYQTTLHKYSINGNYVKILSPVFRQGAYLAEFPEADKMILTSPDPDLYHKMVLRKAE